MTRPTPPAPSSAAEVLRRLERMSQQLDQLLLATATNPHYRR